MVREIQPHILLNGRNGLPEDFATPEQHLSTPKPWRPWEAYVTLNNNWGFYAGDQNWKSPTEIIKLLVRVAQGRGNILLNIGPRRDGTVPSESERIIRTVGVWLETNGEYLRDMDLWTLDPYTRGEHRGDWSHHGLMTISGKTLYLISTSEPPNHIVLTGLNAKVRKVSRLGDGTLRFSQHMDKVAMELPEANLTGLPAVYKLCCDRPVSMSKTGGMRVPSCEHPHYDPRPYDIAW